MCINFSKINNNILLEIDIHFDKHKNKFLTAIESKKIFDSMKVEIDGEKK